MIKKKLKWLIIESKEKLQCPLSINHCWGIICVQSICLNIAFKRILLNIGFISDNRLYGQNGLMKWTDIRAHK